MENLPELFGVIWTDNALGPLSLVKPNAADAIASARDIRAKGAGKVSNVRAVRIPAGENRFIDLDPVTA